MDRNSVSGGHNYIGNRSLSARRAWIEIFAVIGAGVGPVVVALRKESVDRNVDLVKYCLHAAVALRKESVDRNLRCGPMTRR